MSVAQEQTETIEDPVGNGGASARGRPGVRVLFSEADLAGDGVYPSVPTLIIGRSPDCEIFVADRGLSRRHALLRFRGDQPPLVEDLGSHNGTCVNGARITTATPLAAGDWVRCGNTLLVVVDDVDQLRGVKDWGLRGPLVGGPSIRRVSEAVAAFAPSAIEVLITGESGTGKELVARQLHQLRAERTAGADSAHRQRPFVAVNCAAIPAQLFEAELFGAERGAYTGAETSRPGLMRQAAGGTLFFDEIAELPLGLQAKLLRAVELGEVLPLGSGASVHVELRVVAATNQDLAGKVEDGTFRADLWHRLRGAVVTLPPLRERRGDLPLLVSYLLSRHGQPGDPRPAAALIERLLVHDWPGNVRELDRVLHEALLRARAEGARRLLPQHLREELASALAERGNLLDRVRESLTRHRGNVSRAAKDLGLHRAQVYATLRAHQLKAEDFR